MDVRPKRTATIGELRDVAREVVRFVERRRARPALGGVVHDDERDEADGNRDPKRTVH